MLSLLLLWSCATDEAPVLVGDPLGSCTYESPFSGESECRDYFGGEVAAADADCTELESTFEEALSCPDEAQLGSCIFEQDGMQIRATVFGDDASRCGSNRFGCETFAKGWWEPSAVCSGVEELSVLDNPFPQPERVCVDPLPGQDPGQSEGGQVCTWQVVSGATEEGRRFSDYADCSVVQRQRPYGPVEPNDRSLEEDPRMQDPAYVAELGWVRDQLRASACDCCHSSLAPSGPSVFDSDFEGNMANQFNDAGIAMGAGWISTEGFGAYPPEQNNGFWRSSPEDPHLSAIPTTDPQRMIAFFEAEAVLRGMERSAWEGQLYGAGPLDVQRLYEPDRCSTEEGIDAEGRIYWLPGRARYVYVLRADAQSPTVPPNLDTPEGTLWRVDLPAEGEPLYSRSVIYGEVPEGMFQSFPAEGQPEPLVEGEDYYLYAAADVLYPISRCVFTFGEQPTAAGCSLVQGEEAALTAGLGALVVLVRRRRR